MRAPDRSASAAACIALFVQLACGSEDAPRSPSSSASGSGGASTSAATGASGSGGVETGGAAGASSIGGGGSGITFPGDYDCSPAEGTPPPLQLTELVTGFDGPVLVKSAPGDPRLYVVEQSGRIRIFDGTEILPQPFLDLFGQIAVVGEQGLLGLAFHPDYANNGRFFVHYSGLAGGETVIAEYARSVDPDVAEPAAVATVLTIPQTPANNHNGGSIELGADGMLYIALGDGGGSGNPYMTSQDAASLLGKILRIDVSTLPYTIPAGNMPGAAPEVWSMGVRNPWRASFDPCTGDLYFGDVGELLWEEVNVEPAGRGGRNYGWSVAEGLHCFGSASCDTTGLTPPVVEYDHADGRCAVIGGYVHRSSAIPALRGTYFYGDFCTEQIWSLYWDGSKATAFTDWTADLPPAGAGIRSFGQDDDGNVLVISGGTVFRIDAE